MQYAYIIFDFHLGKKKKVKTRTNFSVSSGKFKKLVNPTIL